MLYTVSALRIRFGLRINTGCVIRLAVIIPDIVLSRTNNRYLLFLINLPINIYRQNTVTTVHGRVIEGVHAGTGDRLAAIILREFMESEALGPGVVVMNGQFQYNQRIDLLGAPDINGIHITAGGRIIFVAPRINVSVTDRCPLGAHFHLSAFRLETDT